MDYARACITIMGSETSLIPIPKKYYEQQVMRLKDLTGRKFGKWVALYRVGTRCGQPMWLCRCECGIEKPVFKCNLLLGRSRGCKTCGNALRLPPFRWMYNRLMR